MLTITFRQTKEVIKLLLNVLNACISCTKDCFSRFRYSQLRDDANLPHPSPRTHGGIFRHNTLTGALLIELLRKLLHCIVITHLTPFRGPFILLTQPLGESEIRGDLYPLEGAGSRVMSQRICNSAANKGCILM